MIDGNTLGKSVNVQLVITLVQIIRSLTVEERKILEKELLFEDSELLTQELMQLVQRGGAFDFLHNEPDLYSLKDGEPI